MWYIIEKSLYAYFLVYWNINLIFSNLSPDYECMNWSCSWYSKLLIPTPKYLFRYSSFLGSCETFFLKSCVLPSVWCIFLLHCSSKMSILFHPFTYRRPVALSSSFLQFRKLTWIIQVSEFLPLRKWKNHTSHGSVIHLNHTLIQYSVFVF